MTSLCGFESLMWIFSAHIIMTYTSNVSSVTKTMWVIRIRMRVRQRGGEHVGAAVRTAGATGGPGMPGDCGTWGPGSNGATH